MCIQDKGSDCVTRSKLTLEGFTQSVQKELIPIWNIKLMIVSPGAVKTNFAGNIKYLTRHPAYADDPEAPLTSLNEMINNPFAPAA